MIDDLTFFALSPSEYITIPQLTEQYGQVLRVSDGTHVAEAPFVPYYGEDPAQTLAILNQPVLPEKLPRTAALALNLLRHDIIGHATGQKLSAHALRASGRWRGR